MDLIKLRQNLIEKDFKNMNDRQFEAVTTVNGPLLVLAGAGSGKTTVLVNRVAYLCKYGNAYKSGNEPSCSEEDIRAAQDFISGKRQSICTAAFAEDPPKPWQILAITFTNKAADELKSRIAAKLQNDGADIWAGTFHSICGRILRMNAERIGFSSHFTIYDSDDQKRLMKGIIKDFTVNEKMFPPKSLLSAISAAKDRLESPDDLAAGAGSDLRTKTVARIYAEYQKRLAAADAMDFDDMINNTVRLFRENADVLEHYSSRFRYIMVDEYQDTNHAQYELVRLLGSFHRNVCVVGDDDQSIYRFRGATIENILNFEDDYQNARVIRLEQNYRSTGRILDAANSVIQNNMGRKGKTLWTAAGAGELIEVYTAGDERGEARYVADRILDSVRAGGKFCENAVLYRMNAQSAAMENVFARSGISYRVIGGMRFYDRKEIRDVLAYLNLINNNMDSVRLARIINEPKRGIGETTMAHAAEIAAATGDSVFEVISHADEYAPLSRAQGKLREFTEMITELSRFAGESTISELTEQMLSRTGYMQYITSDTSPDAPDRAANVAEFVNTVKQYEQENPEASLSDFLEETALISDIDSMNQDDDRVTLMTVHSAKGLEFDSVYLIGMEEGIFPGTQSVYGTNEDIEEERRLAYVAITRARKRLVITNAQTRMLYGQTGRNIPSRFLREIPEELCSVSAAESDSWLTGGSFESYGGYNRRPQEYYDRRRGDSVRVYGSGIVPERPGGSGARQEISLGYKAETPQRQSAGGGNKVYFAGQTVQHKAFGTGVIKKTTPMGADTLLEIEFEKVGLKKIMAAYAKLNILNSGEST